MSREFVVGVMGPGDGATPENLKDAWELGQAITQNGWVTLTGARRSGIMEAALRGAKEAGGRTLGIIPGNDKASASAYADIVIVTDMGDARNAINVKTSDVVVIQACESAGTLSEAALAIKARKPVILFKVAAEGVAFLTQMAPDRIMSAETPAEVVKLIRAATLKLG